MFKRQSDSLLRTEVTPAGTETRWNREYGDREDMVDVGGGGAGGKGVSLFCQNATF